MGPRQALRSWVSARSKKWLDSHPGDLPRQITCKRIPPKLYIRPQGMTRCRSLPHLHPRVATLHRRILGSRATPFPRARPPAPASHLIGRCGRGGPGGGAGRAPGRSGRPQQRWAAARVPAESRRAPAEAMRATLFGLDSDTRCALLTQEEEREETAAGLIQG